MTFDLATISNGLLYITLEDNDLQEYADRTVKYLVGIPGFCTRPVCAIYTIRKKTRTLELAAETGLFRTACDGNHTLKNPDCFFVAAVRTGETTILDRRHCPSNCSFQCEDSLHIVPLKKENSTIGVMALALSTNGGPSDDQLKVLRMVTNIVSRALNRLLDLSEKESMTALVHNNPNPIFDCDQSGEVTYANPAAKKILWQHSIEQDELLPENHLDYIRACMQSEMEEAILHRVENETYSWHYHHAPELGRIHLFGVDVSDQKRMESQFAHDAMHDELTGLPNRNQLMTLLRSEFSVIKRRPDYSFTLLLIDLDRFKTVIESLGFEAGNSVLQEIGQRLNRWQGHDKVVARLGEDEFAIIFEDISNIPRIMELARDINKVITEPIRVTDANIALTVSIGIAIGNSETQTAEGILQNASAAVYRAKRKGVNNTEVFDKEMHTNALHRLRVSNELTDAMASGDLTVYYQPIFNLNDLRIRGFEALARWHHPENGLLTPGAFIHIAEETGLIDALGIHVLRLVCRQLTEWKQSRLPLAWVSVNLSAHQFKRDKLVEEIMAVVVQEGTDPSRLYLEITEGTAAEQPDRAFEMMTRLREQGPRIALDDFGTGYSSLSYLKRFPIDTLKIDKSFIDGLPENPDDAAIATSVITMARSLGMKVVAEGVEDERQAMFLRAQHCDEVQGFLYGKPMPARMATNLLKAGPLRRNPTAADPVGETD